MTGKFETQLMVTPDENRMWKLVQPLAYQAENGDKYVVPAGFKTDLASIPKIFHSIFSVNKRHRQAAVVHDYLYSQTKIKRKIADKIFLEAMKASGVPWWKARLFYSAVRLGGGFVRKIRV